MNERSGSFCSWEERGRIIIIDGDMRVMTPDQESNRIIGVSVHNPMTRILMISEASFDVNNNLTGKIWSTIHPRYSWLHLVSGCHRYRRIQFRKKLKSHRPIYGADQHSL